jgi:16S rRNA (guanine527-N7)-methyltransferase
MDEPDLPPEALGALRVVLTAAQERGFLGPGALDPHIRRALELGSAVDPVPERALDLGSGGGLPGLPLALTWPHTEWVLLDGSTVRAAFLGEAVSSLGLEGRVAVVATRAEEAGRGPLRGIFDLVVARSFGPPAVTAECAAPFLRVGGRMLVAEPPGGEPDRWPAEGLRLLGMVIGDRGSTPTAYQFIVQDQECPSRFPRRTGVPAKRPLF